MTERDRSTMKDVSHTSPTGVDADGVWKRGYTPESEDGEEE